MPPLLPMARCALTTPFHPYLSRGVSATRPGGLFSVALSVGLRLPDVIWLYYPVESGLSSREYSP